MTNKCTCGGFVKTGICVRCGEEQDSLSPVPAPKAAPTAAAVTLVSKRPAPVAVSSAALVTRCPAGTAELQREASRRYYPTASERRGVVRESLEDTEHRAECMAEHFAEARASGQTQEDAWADWDFEQAKDAEAQS